MSALAKCRTLIIDDEADTASIGYTKKEGIIEANKIAKQISDLRKAIQNVSFLQVTATPYPKKDDKEGQKALVQTLKWCDARKAVLWGTKSSPRRSSTLHCPFCKMVGEQGC